MLGTKGLTGVTKGMRVDRPGAINRVMIMVVGVAAVHMRVSVAVDVEIAAALVAGTRSRALMKRNRHRHRNRADAFFLLDDRRRQGRRAVIGAGGVVVVDAVGAGVAVPVPVGGSVVGSVVGAAFGAVLGRFVGGGHGGVEGGELAHHALVLVLLVGVDGLGVLPEVVEPGELLAAVAGEGSFAGVFTRNGAKNVGKNMDDDDAGVDDDEQTIMKDRTRETHRMCLARCSDLLKTMRQSVRRQAGDQERWTRVDRTGTKRLTAVASALESFRWRGPVAFVDAVEAIVGGICLRRGRRGRRGRRVRMMRKDVCSHLNVGRAWMLHGLRAGTHGGQEGAEQQAKRRGEPIRHR